MTDKITVLLADDHTLVRRGFRRLLEDDPAIAVVGEASDGDEAIRLATTLKPHVVVMDCAMPGDERADGDARDPAHSVPEIAVLMLSMHSEATLVRQALEAGARGYVLKDALDLDLAGAVKRVAAGETVLDPKVSQPETPKGGTKPRPHRPRARGAAAHLRRPDRTARSPRSSTISVNTVAVHRAHIMNTLDIHKTAELVSYAIRHGLVNTTL